MKSIMCGLGFHKYSSQELHCTELPNKPTFNAAILQQCDRCGETYITKNQLQTTIIVPTKYIVEK